MATRRPAVWHGLGGLCAAGFALLNTGCGLMHPASARDGDPLLGNFNRPITATPPPTGPDIGGPIDGHGPGVYPAPAVGEGIRPPIGPPPTTGNPYSGRITQGPGPATTPAAMAGGWRGPKEILSRWFGPRDADAPRSQSQRSGAAIPLGNRFAEVRPQETPVAWEQPAEPHGVVMRPAGTMLTSGSAMVPTPLTRPQPGPGTPGAVGSVEEGQLALASYGVKWQRLERVENGEWQVTCGLSNTPDAAGYRQYGARHPDPVGAIRAVLQQVQQDR